MAFLWGLLGIQTHTSPSLFIDTIVAELHSHSCRATTRSTTENPLHNPNVEDQHFINLPYNGCVTSITENIPSKEHFSHPLRRIFAEGTGHSLHGFYDLAPDFLVSLTSQYYYLSAPTQSRSSQQADATAAPPKHILLPLSQSQTMGSISQLQYFTARWPWESYLPTLHFSFFFL